MVIVPLFSTTGATRTTLPSPALISPAFVTAEPAGAPAKLVLPDRISWSEIVAVVAIRPLTLTCAVPLMATPDGLMTQTLPFAVSLPEMLVGRSLPMTRFTAREFFVGCAKFTDSLRLMSKDW